MLNQLCCHLPFYVHFPFASVSEADFILLCSVNHQYFLVQGRHEVTCVLMTPESVPTAWSLARAVLSGTIASSPVWLPKRKSLKCSKLQFLSRISHVSSAQPLHSSC